MERNIDIESLLNKIDAGIETTHLVKAPVIMIVLE